MGKSICEGCKYSFRQRREQGEVIAYCNRYYKRVPHDLVYCSGFHFGDDYGMIGHTAWIIDPRPNPPSADKGYV